MLLFVLDPHSDKTALVARTENDLFYVFWRKGVHFGTLV